MAFSKGGNKSGSPAEAVGSATVSVPRMAGAPAPAHSGKVSTLAAVGLTVGALAAGYGLGALVAAEAGAAAISYGARVAGRKLAKRALQARMTGNAAAVRGTLSRMVG